MVSIVQLLHFLLPGGSMGPKCVLQLLFSEKLQNSYTSSTSKAKEKIKLRFGFFNASSITFKNNQNSLNKISHRFLETAKLCIK